MQLNLKNKESSFYIQVSLCNNKNIETENCYFFYYDDRLRVFSGLNNS